MNTSEGRPNALVNKESIEDIQDYDNTAIREMLEQAGMIQTGDLVTADDYEATKNRALFLAKESKSPTSAEALLMAAFADRIKLTEKLGDEGIKNISNDALRNLMYVDTGYKATDEDLDMLRKSPLSFDKWVQERAAAKQKAAGEFDVAVNEEEVIARGTSSREAARRGLDARE